MTTVVIACDTNNGNDSSVQETVANACKQAGYQVEKLPIGPNEYASYSYGENGKDPKGKKGVYLMAASLLSFLDAAQANFDYNVLGIRGDVTEWSDEEWKNKKIPKDHHGDCTMPECDKYQGKTYPELNEIYKGKCVAVPGETPEKLAQNIVSALGGGGLTQNQSSDDEEEEWDDKDNFTPHKGEIMEIKPYRAISSVSYDKSYDSPTGTGNVNILYHSKDYQYLYKGVMMKMKLRRSCDEEWSATGLEKPDYDENEKFMKEHIPTDELLKELGIPNYRRMQREGPSGSASSTTSTDPNASTDPNNPNSDSGSQTGSSSSSSSSSGSSSGSS